MAIDDRFFQEIKKGRKTEKNLFNWKILQLFIGKNFYDYIDWDQVEVDVKISLLMLNCWEILLVKILIRFWFCLSKIRLNHFSIPILILIRPFLINEINEKSICLSIHEIFQSEDSVGNSSRKYWKGSNFDMLAATFELDFSLWYGRTRYFFFCLYVKWTYLKFKGPKVDCTFEVSDRKTICYLHTIIMAFRVYSQNGRQKRRCQW